MLRTRSSCSQSSASNILLAEWASAHAAAVVSRTSPERQRNVRFFMAQSALVLMLRSGVRIVSNQVQIKFKIEGFGNASV